jgi:hypothetical protein
MGASRRGSGAVGAHLLSRGVERGKEATRRAATARTWRTEKRRGVACSSARRRRHQSCHMIAENRRLGYLSLPNWTLELDLAWEVGWTKHYSNPLQTVETSSPASFCCSLPRSTLLTMATDIATLSQLLQASLDPRQNKQGKRLFVYRSATMRCSPE